VFVTNHHVVAGGLTAKVVGAGKVEYRVRGLVGMDRRHDLVLLKTAAPSSASLSLAANEPGIGDQIAVYGAPLGLAGTLSTGIVSSAREDAEALLQITAPISHGSSGSPVVNASGEVVGVVVQSNLNGQALNFAVPAEHVRTLLSQERPVAPLIAAARGAGDDRERHQLVGPVRAVTVVPADPAAGRERLIFDRQGRLVERSTDGEQSHVQYAYDEQGRLKSERKVAGETAVSEWTFTPVGNSVVEGRDGVSMTVRRIDYDEDGRLLHEVTLAADRPISQVQWRYDGPGWPATSLEETASMDDYDAIGNIVRRVTSDGMELRYTYTFDPRGNWISRDAIRQQQGVEVPVGSDRRTIDYWE
jgi:YD repeat-containing protein